MPASSPCSWGPPCLWALQQHAQAVAARAMGMGRRTDWILPTGHGGYRASLIAAPGSCHHCIAAVLPLLVWGPNAGSSASAGSAGPREPTTKHIA